MHVPQLSLQLPLSILSPFIALLCSGIFTNLEQFLMGTLILFLQLNISTCESISQLLLLLNIISILCQCEACFDKTKFVPVALIYQILTKFSILLHVAPSVVVPDIMEFV